jgi:hypothetical protein
MALIQAALPVGSSKRPHSLGHLPSRSEELFPQSCTIVIFGGAGDLSRRKLIPALYNLALDGVLPTQFAVVGFAIDELSDEAFRDFARDGIEPFRAASSPMRTGRTLPSTCSTSRGLQRGRLLCRAEGAARRDRTALRHRRQPGLLSGDPADLHRHLRVRAQGRRSGRAGRSGTALHPPDRRKAHRPRPAERARREPVAAGLLRRASALPHRSLPGQGDGAEHPGDALRQLDLRAAVELQVHRSCADHGGRGRRRRHPRRLLRDRRRAARHGAESHPAAALAGGDGAALEHARRRDSRPPPGPAAVPAPDARERGRAPCGAGAVRVRLLSRQGRAGLPPRGTRGVRLHHRDLVALRLFIDNWRWAGVPIYIRTGKAMPKRVSEVAVQFKAVPHMLFNTDTDHPLEPNVLALRIQPDEGLACASAPSCRDPRSRSIR